MEKEKKRLTQAGYNYDPTIHHRRVGHLKHMSRSPSESIKFAAHAMLDALNKDQGADVFKRLEFDYRAAGHREIADAIVDLAEVLDDVFGKTFSHTT